MVQGSCNNDVDTVLRLWGMPASFDLGISSIWDAGLHRSSSLDGTRQSFSLLLEQRSRRNRIKWSHHGWFLGSFFWMRSLWRRAQTTTGLRILCTNLLHLICTFQVATPAIGTCEVVQLHFQSILSEDLDVWKWCIGQQHLVQVWEQLPSHYGCALQAA